MPLPLIAVPIVAAAASGGASTGTAIASVLAFLGLGGGGGYYWYQNKNSNSNNSHTESQKKQAEILHRGREEVLNEVAEVQELSQEHTDSIDSVALVEQEDVARQKIEEAKSQTELRRLLQVKESALEFLLAQNQQLQNLLDEKTELTQQLKDGIEVLQKELAEKKGIITELQTQLKGAGELVRFFKQHYAPKKENQSVQEQVPQTEIRPANI
ncbi:MAG: hypothetical protein LEGION0403_FIIPPAGN_02331 [Legionella sp.]|uniref:hypothetical protein n=1 Tax=Legionella sp. TaxID=459 RepID=UPI003D0E2912